MYSLYQSGIIGGPNMENGRVPKKQSVVGQNKQMGVNSKEMC